MRAKSEPNSVGQVFAVSGINTISFAIAASAKTKKDLLGFAVQRIDPVEDEDYFMAGFKVFPSVIPAPTPDLQVSTFDHPVQSFVWDDFTAKSGREYEYRFHPIKGKPKNLDRSTPPLTIMIAAEPLKSKSEHDVFFNRGVASSQAYNRRFGTKPLRKLEEDDPKKYRAALDWLSRDLDEALLRFITSCRKGNQLLCCFYEFRYPPAVKALAAAIRKGVDVRIIVDAKVNERTDSQGKFHPSFPREDNLAIIAAEGIPSANVILREARKPNIQHNKFMVRLIAGGTKPTEVWTGSTNLSDGGVHGQTNVGHWVRNPQVAANFVDYWNLLATDPGGRPGDSTSEVKKKNRELRTKVEEISQVAADLSQLPKGVTTVFSPRRTIEVLSSYALALDSAQKDGRITLAFGVGDAFKNLLKDNTNQNPLIFMLLEDKDKPDPKSKKAFVAVNASNNVYKAWGSFVQEPVYQWARETNAGLLGLNFHVSYVHSKFMLIDPLGPDPIVVTGSANFSNASTKDNDENMILIRGDRRVADIYLTEFNRVFNHYYFRSVTEDLTRRGTNDPESLFLREKPEEWLSKYAPGTFKSKRLELFKSMATG